MIRGWEQTLEWLRQPVLGNPLWRWLAGAATAAAIFLLLTLLKRAATARGVDPEGKAGTLRGALSTMARRTYALFLLAVGLLAGSFLLDLGGIADPLRRGLVIVALLQSGAWGVGLLDALLLRWREHRRDDTSAATVVVAAGFLGRLAVWSVVVLVSLDNAGVKVTTLLAGFGVGGIAVALAVQNILGDLFSSVSILLDKPFEVGDFIIVGDFLGTVERIGLKTTRVRSLSGEQVVFANSDLLGSRIRNFKRMSERRVSFSIGVTYETPPEKVAAIPGLLRAIVEAQPGIRFDRAHFHKYGDFALVFEVVYFVRTADYGAYMDTQQAINLAIFRRFSEEGVSFAYPTQTLFVHAVPRAPA